MSSDSEPVLNDPARLRAVSACGLLDSDREEAFDRLSRLAARLLSAPISVLSIVDDRRQFFKSSFGLDQAIRETPLEYSMCKYAVARRGPFVVRDALSDPVVSSSPAVSEFGVRAYAGVPVAGPTGHALGALCVVDTRPRNWSDEELDVLRELAHSAMVEIHLRAVAAELRASEAAYRSLVESAPDPIVTSDADGVVTLCNDAAVRVLGYRREELVGAPISLLIPERFRCAHELGMKRLRAGGEARVIGRTVEVMALRADGSELPVELSLGRAQLPTGDAFTAILRDVSERTRQAVEFRQQAALLQLSGAVATAANQAQSSSEALSAAMSLICDCTGCEVGHVYRVSDGGRLVSTELWRIDDLGRRAPFVEATAISVLSPGMGLPGQAAESGTPVWIPDIGRTSDFLRAPLALACGLRSGFAFPVLVGRERPFVLEFFSEAAQEPSPNFLGVMAHLGMQLGRVVERERHANKVQELSTRDELTGLYNRRGFLLLAAQQLKIAARARRSVVLLFADIDGLKPINDVAGHDAGDRHIVAAAQVLRSTLRDADVVARIGGDEFVALAADADNSAAHRVVERIRANISSRNAAHADAPALSMSIGTTICTPDQTTTIEALIAAADSLMYDQKRGRSRP